MDFRNKKGFTLIELLVVISIISLLSSIILSTVNSARMKAKDAAVKQEVKELAKIIEQDFLNGGYQNYDQTGLRRTTVDKDCLNLTGNMQTEARKICKAIYDIGIGDWSSDQDAANRNKFSTRVIYYPRNGNGTWDLLHPVDRTDLYSITVALPSGRGVYCLSNLGVYEGIASWDHGTVSPCLYWVY